MISLQEHYEALSTTKAEFSVIGFLFGLAIGSILILGIFSKRVSNDIEMLEQQRELIQQEMERVKK